MGSGDDMTRNDTSATSHKKDVALVRRALREYAAVRQYDINPNVRKSRWAPWNAFKRILEEGA
jgi:hypothetical protein